MIRTVCNTNRQLVESRSQVLYRNLSEGSNSYVKQGKEFEKVCQRVMGEIGMQLCRVGGRGDKGVDLEGKWCISDTHHINVIVQCKKLSANCPPNYIRELEGTLSTKMSMFGSNRLLAILASSRAPGEAAINAIKDSRLPMAYFQIHDPFYSLLNSNVDEFSNALIYRVIGGDAFKKAVPSLILGSRHFGGGHVIPSFFFSSS